MAVHAEQSTKVTESLASSQVDHWFRYAKSLEKKSQEVGMKIFMIANLLELSVNSDDLLTDIYNKITTIIGPKEFRPGYQEQPYPHWNAYTGIERLKEGDEVRINFRGTVIQAKIVHQVTPDMIYCTSDENNGVVDISNIRHYRRKP